MTLPEAKRIVKDELGKQGYFGMRLTGRVLSSPFSGGKTRCCVTIHDWKPDPSADAIYEGAKAKGVWAAFQGARMVC